MQNFNAFGWCWKYFGIKFLRLSFNNDNGNRRHDTEPDIQYCDKRKTRFSALATAAVIALGSSSWPAFRLTVSWKPKSNQQYFYSRLFSHVAASFHSFIPSVWQPQFVFCDTSLWVGVGLSSYFSKFCMRLSTSLSPLGSHLQSNVGPFRQGKLAATEWHHSSYWLAPKVDWPST